ncbi:hypothetical protein VPHD456G2_0013 [Vibrio phage D456 g2]
MSARFIRYTLDGIKLTHDIGFGVTDGDGFDVYINRTKLDKNLDYDVIGSVEELRKGNGKITLKAAHAASDVLLILSDTLARRVTNFAKAARFEEAEIDNEFDNLLRLLEDAALNLQSTPYFDPTDVGLVDGKLPPIIANGVLRINASGNGFELILLDELPELQEIIRKATAQADRSESEANKSQASASEAKSIAESIGANPIGNYKGLWPDVGGSAKKEETWQIQVNGQQTGLYFTALKDTAVNPVGDNVNWRAIIGGTSLSQYTDIAYKTSGGRSSVENMVAGIPVAAKVGDICGNKGMQWERVSVSNPSSLDDFRPLMPVTPSAWGLNEAGFNNADAIQSALEYCHDNNVSFIAPTVDADTDKTIFLPNFPSFNTQQTIDFAGMRIRPDDTVFKPMQSGKRVGGVWSSAMSEPLQTYRTFNTKLTGLMFVRDDPETKDGRVALELKDWHQSCELETLTARNFQTALDSYNNFYLNYGNLKLQNAALSSGKRTGIGFIFRTANNLNNIKQLVSQNVDQGYIFEGLVTALHIESISLEGQNHGLATTGEVRGMTVSGTYGEYNNSDSEDFFDFQSSVYNVDIDGCYFTSNNPNTWIIKSKSSPRSAINFGKNNNLAGTLDESRIFENKGYGYRTIGRPSESQGSSLSNLDISESDVGIGTVVEGYCPNIGSGEKTHNIALLNGGTIPSHQSGRMTSGFQTSVMHGLYDPVKGSGQVAFKSKITYSNTQEILLAFKIADINKTVTIRGRMVANQFYEYTSAGLVRSASVTMSAATGFIIFTVTGGLSGSALNVLGAEARVI